MSLWSTLEDIVADIDYQPGKSFEDHCKLMVKRFRDATDTAGIFIRYVKRIPLRIHGMRAVRLTSDAWGSTIVPAYGYELNHARLDGQYVGVGLAFYLNKELWAGGSVCNGDKWHRHMGMWTAIQNAQHIPDAKAALLTGAYANITDAGKRSLLLPRQRAAVEPAVATLFESGRGCEHTLPPWYELLPQSQLRCPFCGAPVWRDFFPRRSRIAVLAAVADAVRYATHPKAAQASEPALPAAA